MKYGLIGVVVLILIGIGAYVMFGREAVAPVATVEPVQQENTAPQEEMSGMGTWQSIFAQGQDVTCTFTATDEATDTRTEGTVYVAGARVRGDFTMLKDDTPLSMSVIRDDTYTYTWGATPEGEMALKFASIDETAPENAATQDPFKSDAQVSYTCRPWSVEEERLTPPADVEFRDMSSLVNPAAGANGEAGAGAGAGAQCAACDAAPEEVRAQCRAALGC